MVRRIGILICAALAADEASLGKAHPRVATDLGNLAAMLDAQGQMAEAETLMRRALEIDEAAFGPDHPRVATDLRELAGLSRGTERLAEAEPLLRRSAKILVERARRSGRVPRELGWLLGLHLSLLHDLEWSEEAIHAARLDVGWPLRD